MTIQWKWEIDLRDGSDRQSAWWTVDGGSWRCARDKDQDHPQEKEMQKKKKKERKKKVKMSFSIMLLYIIWISDFLMSTLFQILVSWNMLIFFFFTLQFLISSYVGLTYKLGKLPYFLVEVFV